MGHLFCYIGSVNHNAVCSADRVTKMVFGGILILSAVERKKRTERGII